MTFDRIVMVDWSGGADRGPKPVKDAIWIAEARGGEAAEPEYLRNRLVAEARLKEIIAESLAKGERVLIGFDFPFGYPKGFAETVTGQADPFALWAWLAARQNDTKDGKDRAAIAEELNALFDAPGPFWFNPFKEARASLPHKQPPWGQAFPEWREAEARAKGTFSLWQLGGAGAVGSQTLTGLPVLERLRHAFPNKVAVWPFEPLDAPVVFTEIWPSLIASDVAHQQSDAEIKDAAQVRVLAQAISRLAPADLAQMLDVDASEEGWILGLGFEDKLSQAARPKLIPPRLKNDCFAMPQGVEWLPVGEALRLLESRLHPVVGQKLLRVEEAQAQVLAKEVIAARSHPPAPNSAVDGYGFAHGSLGPTPHVLPLADGRAAAGQPFSGALAPGHALRVLTGATLPKGVDTVVLEEDCAVREGYVAFDGPVKPGANTRKAGEDLHAGAPVLPKGRRLTAADVGMLRAVGVAQVTCFEPLKVAVLSTGNEISDTDQALPPSQTYDANGPMLRSLMRAWGHEVVDLGVAPDDPHHIAKALTEGAKSADVIFTSGGASAGDEDHMSRLLTEADSFALWRLALKPGRPLAMGLWDETPVFGLPGNPVAAFVCTLIFGYPAMERLRGAAWPALQSWTVPAAFSKRKKAGRREYLRARMGADGVEVFASEGSGRISGLSWADGLVELPDEAVDVTPGTPVTYLPFTSWGL